jgi:hypothetical protein
MRPQQQIPVKELVSWQDDGMNLLGIATLKQTFDFSFHTRL